MSAITGSDLKRAADIIMGLGTSNPGIADECIRLNYELSQAAKQVLDGHVLSAMADADRPDGWSWRPADLTSILDGSYVPPKPSVGRIGPGRGMFYPGLIHALGAESESGKTWIALMAAAHELAKGNAVVYVDFEDSAAGVAGRLAQLWPGHAQEISERFKYIRPTEPLFIRANGGYFLEDRTTALLTEIADIGATSLVVVDGMTEALSLHGLDPNSATDIALWQQHLLRPLARLGPAVVVLDHVVKNTEARGRYDTGSVHKLNGIDGASFTLLNVHPFGHGLAGASDLYIRKDRPGTLRKHGRPAKDGLTMLARFELAADDEGRVLHAHIGPPPEAQDRNRPVAVMERVSRVLAEAGEAGMSKAAIENGIKGDDKVIRQALTALVYEGYVREEAGPRGARMNFLSRQFFDDSTPARSSVRPRCDLGGTEVPTTSVLGATPVGGTEVTGVVTAGFSPEESFKINTEVPGSIEEIQALLNQAEEEAS